MDKERLWQLVLGEIEVTTSRANFNTWFKNVQLESVEDDRVVVRVPSGFAREWLQKKYNEILKQCLAKHLGRVRTIEYRVGAPFRQMESLPLALKGLPQLKEGLAPASEALEYLNLRYTFGGFIVGESNKLAYAAAEAVAKNPGTSYNPLFIYGGVGLGKTHLLQAIGNEAKRNFPKKVVTYITSERFTNEMIEAIRAQKTRGFKEKYRKMDCLLVDDIQFLAGKEQTQEEFFHTFNALYEDNKQIVMTSDRSPKAIPRLEERLRSRFEWGMIADVGAPGYETRLAILKAKSANSPINISDEILEYLAKTIENNVRELEGALTRLIAFSQLNNTAPTLEDVEALIGGVLVGVGRKMLKPAEIVRAVASFYGIKKEELLGNKRTRDIVIPRQVAIYFMREELNLPYKTIGEQAGGRDHTTIMHDYQKVKREILEGNLIKEEVREIKDKLYST